MKNILYLLLACILIVACNTTRKINYTTIQNGEEKTLKGVISRHVIEMDTSFKWFAQNMQFATVDATAVEAFKENADKFNVVVFGGTWCSDTQNLLPVFYKLVAQSGYPEKKILLLGVDRQKQTIDSLNIRYKIANVPTFIVMSRGKEIGRVVEYGTKGAIDKELGEIVRRIK